MKWTIENGDSQKILIKYTANYFDSVVTDPPYGINLIGKKWDYDVPKCNLWKEVYRVMKPGAFLLAFSSPRTYHRAAVEIEDAGFDIVDQIMWMVTTKMPGANKLKPCHEPIVVAQKPINGTMKKNVEEWGVGHINTKDTRIPWDGKPPTGWVANGIKRRNFGAGTESCSSEVEGTVSANPKGRHPSNIIGIIPEQQKYFYAPRVTKKERGEFNDHPSPKPMDLMRYLIKLVTPANGRVLDPFNGSGSTGLGAIYDDYDYVGIEMDKHYCDIANRRLSDFEQEMLKPENLFFKK